MSPVAANLLFHFAPLHQPQKELAPIIFSDRAQAGVYHYLPDNPLRVTTLCNVIAKLLHLAGVVIFGYFSQGQG